MKPAYTFETRYEMSRYDRCAVTIRAHEPVSVTEADALMILRRGFELTDCRPYVVLVDLNDVVKILPEARRVLTAARHVLAVAMLGSPVDRVMAAGYSHASYPAEYFQDKSTAAHWLAVMHDMVCTDPVPHPMSLTVDLDPFARHRY